MKQPLITSSSINFLDDARERQKELSCINHTIQVLRSGQPIEEILRRVVMGIPPGWLYADTAMARIRYGDREWVTPGFFETPHRQAQTFESAGRIQGSVEVFYPEPYPELDEGPFLKEERILIGNIAAMLENFLSSHEAREGARQQEEAEKEQALLEFEALKGNKVDIDRLLQRFLINQNTILNTMHDLMPFRVKEIMLIATLYDTFTIEKDGRFSEHILGEHYQNNIVAMPRITGVSTPEEAMAQLRRKHFDIIIILGSSDRSMPFTFSSLVKARYPYMPIFLLVSSTDDLQYIRNRNAREPSINRIFVRNNDNAVFFAMVKHLEDSVNAENDTQVGLIKVILLVEDSESYYSRYLPLLYKSVFDQTGTLLDEVDADPVVKRLRMRLRPKIMLADNYESALEIARKFRDNLMCVITDVSLPVSGEEEAGAGFSLVRELRSEIPDLPIVIQSSEPENAHRAFEMKAIFINKESDSLFDEIRSFINHQLGFGIFTYRDASGRKIMSVRTLQEFEKQLDTIPDESLVYHARRNHFSLWLMARGEIQIAKKIYLIKVSDFENVDEYRRYMKFIISRYRNESNAGKVVDFEEKALLDENNIVCLSPGGLGGKGRGLAFVNTLIYNLNFSTIIPGIRICTPRTAMIGLDEFDIFMERNNLRPLVASHPAPEVLNAAFLKGELSFDLMKKLRVYLKNIDQPLAVRSSSQFEDSLTQPLSGIFSTFMLPNNHPDINVRMRQLSDAIKLVYASMYSEDARSYFHAVHYDLMHEKMSVVLQEVVGRKHDRLFFPDISGTAQSHNYYPVALMEPEDGFAVCALGLGKHVMEGGKTYRFSPKYPSMEIHSVAEMLKNTQTTFLAIDLQNTEPNLSGEGEMAGLRELPVEVAAPFGVLAHTASTYLAQDDRLEPGIAQPGPRVINFADILKYRHIPLAPALELILDLVRKAMGTAVEIEFAVDLSPGNDGLPSFYLLQIKPLTEEAADFEWEDAPEEQGQALLFSQKTVGNGRITNLCDIVFVDPELFDKTRTPDLVPEIQQLNAQLAEEGKRYVLIGPGRWGTRDRFIGIPVNWPQISNARLIVELDLPDLPLDASLGSHFFHNVTSMHIGYMSVHQEGSGEYINWELLRSLPVIRQTKHVRHVRCPNNLDIRMDGRKRRALILVP